jgi:hypothetical protein
MMPYLRITATAHAAMKAYAGDRIDSDETAEYHDDGTVSFFMTAATVARLQRHLRRGETLSDVIERFFAAATRKKP